MHERFKELAALAACGVLTTQEKDELLDHLHHCDACRKISREYQALGVEVIALAAGHDYDDRAGLEKWDDTAVRQELFKRVQKLSKLGSKKVSGLGEKKSRSLAWWVFQPGLAALILIGVASGAYWSGTRQAAARRTTDSSAENRAPRILQANPTDTNLLEEQAATITRLRRQYEAEIQEEERLRAEVQSLTRNVEKERGWARHTVSELQSSEAHAAQTLRDLSVEHDELLRQISETKQALDGAELELTNSRAQLAQVTARANQLETQVNDLSSINEEQSARLAEDEKYLASDRDIRDLMSARNLYIADVFDVDSSSQTRKPFGRVFYTRGKSLVFYAFDLDRTPTVRKSSAFQVWGQKDKVSGDRVRPRNLGILYLDSESNRRWILKSDDPATLEGIDAVFVTVEPHGGSPEPTGKPFLYAQLRKPPNHP